MILDRVGECLQYGLTREVFTSRKDFEFKYLKAAIVYLILEGYIDRSELNKVTSLYPFNGNEAGDNKKQFEMLRFVMSRLKKKISFQTFEELVGKLNTFKMPEWMYEDSDKLLFLLPDAYLVDDVLYYIKPKDGSFQCEMYNTDKCMDETDEMDEEPSVILSHKYSRFLGYNEEEEIFYLSLKKIQDAYVEYHFRIGLEQIIHKRCIGIINNTYPICVSDKYLMVKANGAWNRIKKVDEKEEYALVGNRIFVTPKSGFPAMFEPYWMNPSGRVIPLTYRESKDYLWRQIQYQFSPFWARSAQNKEDDECFTLGLIEEFISKNFDIDQDEYARMFFSLIKLLGHYFPADADVLQHFYIIMEASYRYEEEVEERLSQSLLARLEELDAYDELGRYIYDLTAFRKKLLETIYWDDNKITEAEKKRNPRDKIGYFTIRRDKIKAYTYDINKGVCMGSLVMIPGIHKKGIVAYNMERDMYEIQYCRLLNEKEMEEIIQEFNLEYKKYCFMVEEDELIEENLIYDW